MLTQMKVKVGQNGETTEDKYNKDELLSVHSAVENSSNKEKKKSELESKSRLLLAETIVENHDLFPAEQTILNEHVDLEQDDRSEDGWQEAFPKGCSSMVPKASWFKEAQPRKAEQQLHEHFSGFKIPW